MIKDYKQFFELIRLDAPWKKGHQRPFAFDPNSTSDEGRFRLYPPELLHNYIRVHSKYDGIDYIFGKTASGKQVQQTIRFDTSKYPFSRAKQWWESHKDSFKFYGK